MMRDELSAISEGVLASLKEHPFWAGLRGGTLPPACLWYFAEQDTRYVVPAYARALARAAATADDDGYSALLCAAAAATFASIPRMASQLAALAAALGRPPDTPVTPVGRTSHAHASFMFAGAAASFAAGLGALLPMTWFHLLVCDDLRLRHQPGGRYLAWIDQYCPGDGYAEYVEAYLTMIDEFGGQCSAAERSQLVTHFLLGVRHEWAFADAAWHRQPWGV
jgi:thiaminase (transcriptional activator TenA)